jgi:glycosyltransferase involved in cell wall biosynthesis
VRVDQLLPGFARHDAISNHVLAVRTALRAAGLPAEIYAEAIDPALAGEARPAGELPDAAPGERILLYHASTLGARCDWLIERARAGERLFLDYHNITPAAYFARWLPDAAADMAEARRQLVALAPHVELAMAVSAFNERELRAVGYADTVVCPPLVDLARYHDPPDRRVVAALRRAGGSRWLFVGRFAPNKCMHDVIAAFAVYRRAFDPSARLSAIGGITSPRYFRALQTMADDLGVGDAVELVDQVDRPALLAYFAASDVFVCLSEHEGFCVPVLEAMELGLPVVAYAAAALPETVGDAGVLVADKDPLAIAVTVADLLADTDRRHTLVAAGRARAATLDLPATSARLVSTLRSRLD